MVLLVESEYAISDFISPAPPSHEEIKLMLAAKTYDEWRTNVMNSNGHGKYL